ncbi:hypothetical protein PMV_118 [Port-miou virus]|nr:hypothetical protein PMV_118 [Port-miou virus]
MQKFLEKREALVLCLVSEDVQLLPADFRKKTRQKVDVPLFDETQFIIWDEMKNGKKKAEIRDKCLENFSGGNGTMRVSLLPDGTKDGPFHMTPKRSTYWTVKEATGNYKMGKKHGYFRYVFHLHTKVIREEMWDEDFLEQIKIVCLTSDVPPKRHNVEIYRFFKNGSGIYKDFSNGRNLSESVEFKNGYLHGEQEFYGRERGCKKLRVRRTYNNGTLVSEEIRKRRIS